MCGKNGAHGPNVQHRVERDSTFELGLAVNQLLRETIHVMEILQSPESALQLSVQVMIFLVVDLNLHFTFICCPLFALFFQLLFIISVFFSWQHYVAGLGPVDPMHIHLWARQRIQGSRLQSGDSWRQ